MSDQDATQAGLGPVGAWEDLRDRFEAAWLRARRGEPEPRLDEFLQQVTHADRERAREILEPVERASREWMERVALEETLAGGETMAPERRKAEGEPADSSTMREGDGPSGDLDATLAEPAGPERELRLNDDQEPGATVAFEREGTTSSVNPYGATLASDFPSTRNEDVTPDPTKAVIVEGYEILGELGRGGMGVVYKARQTGLNRVVALKMIIAGEHAGEEQLARFQIEAESVASLQHPNIVQIFDVGQKGGMPYFSLEFVDGGSLQQTIDGKPQTPRFAAQMTESLALAMQAAHDRGVIHRDLKPANILMSLHGTPKITDFGLAKKVDADSHQTQSGALMGTPSYMAPEQARGDTREIGPHSDLYAIGAILYELLTGRPPFQGATILDTLDQVRSQEPVPPTRLQPKIPRDLETICLKCLQKEPKKRYPSAGELADDLHRFLNGEAIRARPVGRMERGWRWCRRNPRVAALSGLVGVLMVLVAASGVVFAARAVRERQTESEVRWIAGERFDRATEAIAEGNYPRALDLLNWSDPLVRSTPSLADVRQRLDRLRRQVEVYAEFHNRLEIARFEGLFGDARTRGRARDDLHHLLALYEQIEKKTGPAEDGLPPLSETQQQLFKEDVFDAFLIASQVEWEYAVATGQTRAKNKAARQAITWLDRANTVLPGTKTLPVRRLVFKEQVGDQEGARIDSETAASIVPSSPVDHFWHAFASRLRGREALGKNDGATAAREYTDAKSELSMLLQARPDDFWGYLEWASCQFELNNFTDAVIGYTACVQLRPRAPWPYNNRAAAYLQLARRTAGDERKKADALERSIADYDIALKLDPRYVKALDGRAHALLESKEPKRALKDFDRALAAGLSTASVHMGRAQALERLDRLDEALTDYDRVIGIDPRNALAHYQKAIGLFHQGNLTASRDSFSKVIELLPLDPAPVRNRANVNFALKDFAAAIEDWSVLARLLPKDPEPQYYLGVLHMGQRRYDEARAEIEAALGRNPLHARALLARARLNYWQGEPEKALEDINRVVDEIEPKRAYYLNDRPDVLRALGRLDEAKADCERSIEMEPEQVDAYVSLALTLQQMGNPDKARICYDQMVERNPKNPRAWLLRAECLRDRGEFQQALSDCETAQSIDPRSALPGLARSGILAAQGHPEEAVKEVERLLPDAPAGEGHALYASARVYSMASKSKSESGDTQKAGEYADRAYDLLNDALSRGFHDLNYQEQDRMATDPALTSIRDQPRVEALIRHRPEASTDPSRASTTPGG